MTERRDLGRVGVPGGASRSLNRQPWPLRAARKGRHAPQVEDTAGVRVEHDLKVLPSSNDGGGTSQPRTTQQQQRRRRGHARPRCPRRPPSRPPPPLPPLPRPRRPCRPRPGLARLRRPPAEPRLSPLRRPLELLCEGMRPVRAGQSSVSSEAMAEGAAGGREAGTEGGRTDGAEARGPPPYRNSSSKSSSIVVRGRVAGERIGWPDEF